MCTSTSCHRREGSSKSGRSRPLTSRVRFAHASAGSVRQASSTASAERRTSSMISAQERVAPAAISASRPAKPPVYWSAISPRRAACARRTWLSAFRARWLSTCPTVHPGRRLGRRTCSFVIASMAPTKRRCAFATRAMSCSGTSTRKTLRCAARGGPARRASRQHRPDNPLHCGIEVPPIAGSAARYRRAYGRPRRRCCRDVERRPTGDCPSIERSSRARRAAPRRSGLASVLRVGHVVAPGWRTLGEREMRHEVVMGSAVPVLLTVGGPDRIASADLDDRFAP